MDSIEEKKIRNPFRCMPYTSRIWNSSAYSSFRSRNVVLRLFGIPRKRHSCDVTRICFSRRIDANERGSRCGWLAQNGISEEGKSTIFQKKKKTKNDRYARRENVRMDEGTIRYGTKITSTGGPNVFTATNHIDSPSHQFCWSQCWAQITRHSNFSR